MNPFAASATAVPFAASATMAAGVNFTAAPPPAVKGPGPILWVVGIGGVVLLGGLVAAVVLTSPSEAPGARDYHRRRQRHA